MNNEPSQFVSVTQQQALSFIQNIKQQLEKHKKIQVSINKKNLQQDGIDQINFQGQLISNTESNEDPFFQQSKAPVLRKKRLQSKTIKEQQQSSVQGKRRNHKQSLSTGRTNLPSTRVHLTRPPELRNIRPKEAKNIIKNIINGFKKFPRLLDTQTMTRIVNKVPHAERSIILEKRLESNMKDIAIIVKKQYFEVFKQNMYGEQPAQKKQRLRIKKIENQKSNDNTKKDKNDQSKQQKDITIIQFNKALVQQIFQRNELRQIFLFWLQQCAHYYITKQSKVGVGSQRQHRAAIQTLLQTLGSTKVLNPPIPSKKQIFKQNPIQNQLFLKCPSFKHQITQTFPQPTISRLFRRQKNSGNQPLTNKKYYKNKQYKFSSSSQHLYQNQSQNNQANQKGNLKREQEGVSKKRKLQ